MDPQPHAPAPHQPPTQLLWAHDPASCRFVQHVTAPAFEVQMVVSGVVVAREFFAEDSGAAAYVIRQRHVYTAAPDGGRR